MVIENYILNEVLKTLATSKGLNISVYLAEKFGVTTNEKVAFYKTKLKSDGHVVSRTLPDRSLCYYITPTGEEFIKNRGYPESLQALALQLIKDDQAVKPISKVNQHDQSEIKEFVDEVTQIKESIQHQILVMDPSELRPILIKLEVIIKDYFGKESRQFDSYARAKKLRYKGRVIPVLTRLLTEEEIRYKKIRKTAGATVK